MTGLKHCFQCSQYKKEDWNYCEKCGEVLVEYLPKELVVYKKSGLNPGVVWYFPNLISVETYTSPRFKGTEYEPKKVTISNPTLIKAILEEAGFVDYPTFVEISEEDF